MEGRLKLASDTCLPLDIFCTRAPLVLKTLVKTQPIDVFGPPFPPTCEKYLFWILWKVVLFKPT